MGRKIPLHFKVSEKVMEILKTGANRRSISEKFSGNTIEQVSNDVTTFQMVGEIFISSADIYKGLGLSAIKLVIQIQQELEMNNPLWECTDRSKKNIRTGLAQLKRAGIIDPIEGTDVFIVNPAKIRKGRPLAVYGALYEYSKRMWEKNKDWHPTTEDIRRLKAPEKVMLIPEVITKHQSHGLTDQPYT